MAFEIAPKPSTPPPPGGGLQVTAAAPAGRPLGGEFVQWQRDGASLGDTRAQVIDFVGPGILATRGVGANAHVITVRRISDSPPAPPPPPPPPEFYTHTITMSELSIGTVSPVFSFPIGLGVTTDVSTGNWFAGQSLVGHLEIAGSPSSPLVLQQSSNLLYRPTLQMDDANPEPPVLAGANNFDATIAMLFSRDITELAFTWGDMFAPEVMRVTLYSRSGAVVHTAANVNEAVDSFSWVSSGTMVAGFLVSAGPMGGDSFAIDTVVFKYPRPGP